jgi:hypothetical protein
MANNENILRRPLRMKPRVVMMNKLKLDLARHVLITTPRTPQAYTPGTVTGVRAWEDIQAYTKIIKGNK